MKKILIWILLITFSVPSAAAVRLKDMAQIENISRKQVIGYGLVVGLDGTGDSRRSLMANQSLKNMVKHFGLTLPNNIPMRVKNVAAVMVTAEISPFLKRGNSFDVQVSSMGDAKSLEGGVLLLTPLIGNDQKVYGHAQGAISIGGFNIETNGGEKIRQNYALVGRIPGGAILDKDLGTNFSPDSSLYLALREPDFTTAFRTAQAINQAFGNQIARAIDAGHIKVEIPSQMKTAGGSVQFMSKLEEVEVTPDEFARVVVNERTGTIVVGTNVTISQVAISHGNLSVEVSAQPVISQPAPFSRGQTVVVPQTQTQVNVQDSKLTVVNQTASIQDLAKALNALGVTPRDMIAIFQALKQAGALKAELVIM